MARDDETSGSDDGFAPSPASDSPPRPLAPTPDRLWRDHAESLQRLAHEALGDDADAVKVACYRTLLRAAREVADSTSPVRPEGWWAWLSAIADDVCHELAQTGFSPNEVPDQPLPAALPAGLRTSLFLRAARDRAIYELEAHGAETEAGETTLRQRRAWEWERARRRLRGLPVAVLLPRKAWEACGRSARTAREWCRRVEAHVAPTTPGAPRLANLLAGSPVLSDAAVAVTAALALGAGAAPAPPPSHAEAVVPVAAQAEAPQPRVTSPAPTTHDTLLSPFPPPARTQTTTTTPPSAPTEPSPADNAVERPQPSTPAITTTPKTEAKPVTGESHEEGYHYDSSATVYETPWTRAKVDVDGDGDPEADVGTPYVFVTCTAPDHRGAVTGAVCPALEATGDGE